MSCLLSSHILQRSCAIRQINVHMYARRQIFIQLSPIVTKLCHIKCDHPACVSVDGGHFEHIMVVALKLIWHNFVKVEGN